jgi:Zn-dependent protease/predicted transcriptional regulator
LDGKSGFRIASIRGIDIRIDASWLILFFLILWSLSAGTFPVAAPGLEAWIYLVMGLLGALLFFASILLHELAHCVVAQSRGIGIEGITLFVFGGVAHTRSEPQRPDDELVIAGAGPVVSLALGSIFLLLGTIGRAATWSPLVLELAGYLAYINLVLAIFNLLPGYPLDGGRVFRAVVWKRTGDLARATRWATSGGRWIGLGLIALGIAEALMGAILGGAWLILIGMFLRGAASTAAYRSALEHILRTVRAADVMSRTPIVDAHISLRDLAQGAAMRSPLAAFPVRAHGRIVGTLPVSALEGTPRHAWSSTAVGQVMSSLDQEAVVTPDTLMTEVIDRIRSAGQVFVMQDQNVLGSISRSDLALLAARFGMRGPALAGS